jgi:hypothetical protein
MTDINKDIQKAMVTGAVILASGIMLDKFVRAFSLGNVSKLVAIGANTLLTVRKVLTVGLGESVPASEEEEAYQSYSPPETVAPPPLPFLATPPEPMEAPNNPFFALTPEQMKAYEAIKARQQTQGSAMEGKSFLEV